MKITETLDTIAQALIADIDAHPFGRRLFAGKITREEYAAFLVQSYLYVVHTRPLLCRAGKQLARQGKGQLADLFRQKANEENGHEQWALEDLRAIGKTQDAVKHTKPAPGVAAYLAWNSFTVEHGSPIAFLGTAYVLEYCSANCVGAVVTNLVKNSGIRGIEHAVHFLRGHADADVDHIMQMGHVIEALASSDTDCCNLVLSAWVTRSSYIGLLTAVAAEVTRRHDAQDATCAA